MPVHGSACRGGGWGRTPVFPNVGYPSVVDDSDADSDDVDARGGEFHGVRKCRCMAWHVEEGGRVERRCSRMSGIPQSWMMLMLIPRTLMLAAGYLMAFEDAGAWLCVSRVELRCSRMPSSDYSLAHIAVQKKSIYIVIYSNDNTQ